MRTLHLAFGSSLEGGLDLIVAGALLNAAGQVNNGDVAGRHTHGHASELSIEIGDDLADSLSGTGGGGDDVLGRSTAATPVLGRRTIDGLLSGGVRVDGGHQTLDDGVFVVDDLGQGRQAVGGAGGVGNDGDIRGVGLFVDAHDEHGGIGGWGRDDNLLGTTLQVCGGLLGGGEDTSGLDDVIGAGLAPGDSSRVPLGVEADLLAVDLEVLAVDLDLTLELAVGGVVLEHVRLGTKHVSAEPGWRWSCDADN